MYLELDKPQEFVYFNPHKKKFWCKILVGSRQEDLFEKDDIIAIWSKEKKSENIALHEAYSIANNHYKQVYIDAIKSLYN